MQPLKATGRRGRRPQDWSTAPLILFAVLCGAALAAQTAPDTSNKLVVDGDIAAPLTLSLADLAKMPRETATLTEMDGSKTVYDGVPLVDLLEKAGLAFGKEMRGKALAGYVLAEARDGYQVVFSLGELDPGVGGTRVIVSDQRDGKPLSAQQGPMRLVVTTDKRPARAVRMLEKLHVVALRK
ncbi:MAG TPA: molybdopterin-dependent oxidoreductase [Bryobacteraceae bacterium]|jgi:DMSO/TMAO reductase YedYZ molybdopterin-dependent catalytic subunit|nr:molybdopterin-dependent oxidoreductase [Bryobacteraceae bacterium]